MKRTLFVSIILCISLVSVIRTKAQENLTIDTHSISKQLLAPNTLFSSISDSIIYYSQQCLSVPVWYKISIDSRNDTLFLWITAVQYFDSTYYKNNKSWIQQGIFSMSSEKSIGVYYHSDCLFEVIADKIYDNMLVKCDSLISVECWQHKTTNSFMKGKSPFPHYYQMLVTIDNTLDHKTTISQEICSCNRSHHRQKIRKPRK